MCYKFLPCESKMASIFSGKLSGLPTKLPTIYSYLKVVGCPLSCTLSCPLYPYMEVVCSLICMAKFPWAAHGQPTPLPTELPTFSHLEVVGCPLSCPLFPYMEIVGSLIYMAKFPWAAHGQLTPLPTELPTVSIYGSSGQPTELPTELPTVSIYGSSGQPNLHGKIPMGSPRAAHYVAHVQPTGSEVGSSPVFFRMGTLNFNVSWKHVILGFYLENYQKVRTLNNLISYIACRIQKKNVLLTRKSS